MAKLGFDQVNIVVPDVIGAAGFLRNLGAEVQETTDEWADRAAHHAAFPASHEGFDADLDSPAFASYWGGLPRDFAGVVVNLRAADRSSVDSTFDRALKLARRSSGIPTTHSGVPAMPSCWGPAPWPLAS